MKTARTKDRAKKRITLADARQARLNRWGKKLAKDVAAIVKRHPDVDPEDVRLTLISLQLTPLERLNRSLRRGRGFAAFKK